MKAPAGLKVLLRRQWENRARRESRLLRAESSWPIVLSIGHPSSRLISTDLEIVKNHIESWRRVNVGEVVWEAIRYRATEGHVDIPIGWKLRRPSEWIDACGDDSIRRECEALATLVEQTDANF